MNLDEMYQVPDGDYPCHRLPYLMWHKSLLEILYISTIEGSIESYLQQDAYLTPVTSLILYIINYSA